MIPFKDENPTRTFPYVTIAIIVVNALVFLWELVTPLGTEQISLWYGAIPSYITSFQGSNQPVPPALSVVTSMFLHGGLLHIAGNMLYLWIFGNNIEDALGHFRFILFYLFSGFVAAYGHALTEPHSMVPMIGASGAISGMLGAYIVLYPRAKILTLVFFGFFIQILKISAIIVIGFWIVLQIVSGLLAAGTQQGGVAWFAHVGGFLAGVLTIKLWLLGKKYRT